MSNSVKGIKVDETTVVVIGIILAVGILVSVDRALDRRAASRGKPLPGPLTRPGLLATVLLLLGGLIVIVGALVFDSWPIQIVGVIVAFGGAALRWYWWLRGQV